MYPWLLSNGFKLKLANKNLSGRTCLSAPWGLPCGCPVYPFPNLSDGYTTLLMAFLLMLDVRHDTDRRH